MFSQKGSKFTIQQKKYVHEARGPTWGVKSGSTCAKNQNRACSSFIVSHYATGAHCVMDSMAATSRSAKRLEGSTRKEIVAGCCC